MAQTNLTDRRGVNLVEGLILNELGWVFREQYVSDEGVDAQVETRAGSTTTGRLLALQIKTGPSYFAEPKDDGWVLRFGDRQARLWLNHALPVIIVLVDPAAQAAYWQRVSPTTLLPTGRQFKVHVPASQTVASARDPWEHFASGIEERAVERYASALLTLPPGAAKLIGKLRESQPEDGAVLALHLAEGRRNPRATVEALLLAEPMWLGDRQGLGWTALALYSAAHGLLDRSADAFERAAAAGEERRGKRLAAAGINVSAHDRDRAKRLLDQAAAFPDAEVLVRVGRAALEHPDGDARPRVVDPPLPCGEPEVDADAFVQDFLADQAMRAADIASAIRHARRACELEPDNADYGIRLASALGRRSLHGRSSNDDLRESVLLLTRAVDQRHAWDGPTEGVLEDLLRALVLTGNDEAILTYALAPPLGIARVEEAARPKVLRLALRAASRLSREELAIRIAGSLGTSPHDQLDRFRAGLIDLSAEETLSMWNQVAVDAEAEQDYELLLTAVLNEASNGYDDTPRLGPLLERGIIPAGMVRLANLIVQAHEDLDGALPGLRALARTDMIAAEHVISLLVKNERYEEAAAACRQARETYKQDFFLISEANVYLDADNLESAEAVALSAVNLDGFPRERAKLLTFLAGRAADRGEWVLAEDFLTRVLPLHGVSRASDVWRLVIAQLNRGDVPRAAATVLRYAPDVRTPAEATLWLRAMAAGPWDQSTASTALSLAGRFEEEEELVVALLGSIISSTTTASPESSDDIVDPADEHSPKDPRPIVDADLHKRAFAALERLVQRNPTSGAVQLLQGSADELLEHITRILRQDSERSAALRELLEKAQQGELPVGLLATGTGKSYSLLLVQQAAGLLVAAAAQDAEHELDLSAAAEALNRLVVVDASALLLTSQLDGGETLRGRFAEIAIPAQSRRDIVRATVEAKGMLSSPGSIHWDDRAQRAVYSEVGAAELLRIQSRAEALDNAAQGATTHTVQEISLFPELSDQPLDDAWLAPIQLAHETTSALWSDDLGQRRLARSVGVSSFGTPALVELLNEVEMDQLDVADDNRLQELILERQTWVRQFIRESVVDVPAHLEDLINQAELDGWQPLAAATVLTRPSWWAWQSNAVRDWGQFIEAAAHENPEAATTWQHAAMIGISRTYVSREFGSAMLAVVALVGLGNGTSVADAVTGLLRAREVASGAELPDPVSHLAVAARGIAKAGRIEDPEQFTSEVLNSLPSDTPHTGHAGMRESQA